MANARSPRQYTGVRAIAPPDLTIAERGPGASDTAYQKGQLWLDTVGLASYQFTGVEWITLGGGVPADLESLTGTSGGAVAPVGGNISILGDAVDGISVVGTTGTLTINAAVATTTQRGTLETSTNAESVTGTDILVAVTPASLTARLAAPGAIGATTPAAGTFTSVTATAGNITAANGNFVRGTAGNKDVYSNIASTIAAGANSAGRVVLVGGTATISTTAITASSIVRLYRQGVGATGAAALGNLSLGTVVAGTSFVINAWSAASATVLAATDVSIIGWEIVN